MRYQGSVVEWNAARGFGFVRRHDEQRRVFVHVSAFARHSQPAVGDVVTYAIERDPKGRPRAIDVQLAIPRRAGRERIRRRDPKRTAFEPLRVALLAVVIALLGAYAWSRYSAATRALDEASASAMPARPAGIAVPSAARPAFTCAGKRTCPEMTSCAEATFYLRHCSGTLQDGDGDSVSCEDQWCGP